MLDHSKIPEPTYRELVELFGIGGAEEIILKKKYNFKAISMVIAEEKMIRYLGLVEIRSWIQHNLGLSLRSVFIIFSLILLMATLLTFVKLTSSNQTF